MVNRDIFCNFFREKGNMVYTITTEKLLRLLWRRHNGTIEFKQTVACIKPDEDATGLVLFMFREVEEFVDYEDILSQITSDAVLQAVEHSTTKANMEKWTRFANNYIRDGEATSALEQLVSKVTNQGIEGIRIAVAVISEMVTSSGVSCEPAVALSVLVGVLLSVTQIAVDEPDNVIFVRTVLASLAKPFDRTVAEANQRYASIDPNPSSRLLRDERLSRRSFTRFFSPVGRGENSRDRKLRGLKYLIYFTLTILNNLDELEEL